MSLAQLAGGMGVTAATFKEAGTQNQRTTEQIEKEHKELENKLLLQKQLLQYAVTAGKNSDNSEDRVKAAPEAGPVNNPTPGKTTKTTPTKSPAKTPETTQSSKGNSQCSGYAQKAKSTCSSALSSVNGLSSSFTSLASQFSGQQQTGAANACAQMEKNLTSTSSQISGYQNSCQSEVTNCNSSCSDDDSAKISCTEAELDLNNIKGQLAQVESYNTNFRQCRADATTGDENAAAKLAAMDGSAFQNLNSNSGSSSIYQSPTASATTTSFQPQGMAVPQTTTANSNPTATDSSLGNAMSESVDSMVKSPYQKSEMKRNAEQSGGAGNKMGGSGAVAGSAHHDGLKLLAGRSRYDTQINQGSYDEAGGRRSRMSANNNWDSASAMGSGSGYGGRRMAGSRADSNTEQVDLTRFLPGAPGNRGASFGPGGGRRGPASVDGVSSQIAGPHTSLFRLQRYRYNIVPTVYTDNH
ncbi:MAG: hypothetical protein ABS42_00270 [Bdellovibrio sp. SCN 50-8]|nr:MAG: hypothetical protein ABS42_00270 [Bdellovibrio sp. SCN 50-8]